MPERTRPEGYNSVSPYLVVDGADATIAFLERVFGATALRRVPGEDGKVLHAEVRIDDTVVMLADADPPSWSALPSNVHVYVADVDDVHARAVEAGAESVQAPVQKDDDDRRGGVRDAGGTTWWIATTLGR